MAGVPSLPIRTAWLSFAVASVPAGLPAQQDEPAFDLPAELARVVDAPTPAERRAAADRLAADKDLSIEALLAAMAAFAPAGGAGTPAEGMEAGVRRATVPLHDGTKLEDTELFLYVPEKAAQQGRAPLLCAAHGTGGSGRGQHRMWQATADALGMAVLCPSESGPNEGYAYSERERQLALSALRWARRQLDVDEDRVFSTGISRGGHLAWDLALRHPDLWAAIAPMIGGPRLNIGDGQNNLRYVENVVRLPIRDLQGTGDHPLLLFNLHLAFDELKRLGAHDAELIEFPDLGHGFRLEAVDWRAFFGKARRDPRPARVVRIAARKGEGRAFWLEVLATSRKVEDEFRPRFSAEVWNALDDEGRRKLVAEEAKKRSARVEAHIERPGLIVVSSDEVSKLRILLAPDMLDEKGKVEVRWNGKTRKATPRPQKQVLLREFAERFDRGFLPVAEIRM